MKKVFISVILMSLFGGLNAQTSKPMNLPIFDFQPFHLGYAVGINWMGFTPATKDGYEMTVKQNPGVNLNLVASFNLAKYLDLRVLPGIQFGQRDVEISYLGVAAWDAKIESVYIDMPILFKYRSKRVNNYAPYLIGGINPKFDLTGGEIIDWVKSPRLIKAFDVFPELGFGIDFYLEKMKVSTELKFAVGMINIYRIPDEGYDTYKEALRSLMSRMVVFSINIG